MVRYSLLRLLIFFGFLLLFWLIGIRDNPVLLIGAAALSSAAASYVLLRGMRDEITAGLVERHEARVQAKQGVAGSSPAPSSDEAAEDAEVDGVEPADRGDARDR
jgi:hypothetical protein